MPRDSWVPCWALSVEEQVAGTGMEGACGTVGGTQKANKCVAGTGPTNQKARWAAVRRWGVSVFAGWPDP